MESRFEEVTSKAMALPPESRAELAELLIQSLDESEAKEIKASWVAEIRRRDMEIRSGAPVTKSADQVLTEAREELRCIN
jgi:putative addiction module component (TIGR02574 family)